MKLSCIQSKSKPCRGQGIAKGFGCGKPTEHRKYGLGKSCCLPNWYLTTDNGKVKLAKASFKVSRPRIEMEKAIEEKKSRESLSWLKKNVRDVCHEYIRLRDKGKPCISCDQPWKPDFQAGHFYKAEMFSNLKYDEDNISGQCIFCNGYKDGNESGYRIGIKTRYGMDFLAALDLKSGESKRNALKWERASLIEIREYYRGKIKELKAAAVL